MCHGAEAPFAASISTSPTSTYHHSTNRMPCGRGNLAGPSPDAHSPGGAEQAPHTVSGCAFTGVPTRDRERYANRDRGAGPGLLAAVDGLRAQGDARPGRKTSHRVGANHTFQPVCPALARGCAPPPSKRPCGRGRAERARGDHRWDNTRSRGCRRYDFGGGLNPGRARVPGRRHPAGDQAAQAGPCRRFHGF